MGDWQVVRGVLTTNNLLADQRQSLYVFIGAINLVLHWIRILLFQLLGVTLMPTVHGWGISV